MDLIKRFVARFRAVIALYIRYTYEQPNNLIGAVDCENMTATSASPNASCAYAQSGKNAVGGEHENRHRQAGRGTRAASYNRSASA